MAFTPGEEFLITTNGNSNDISIIDVKAEKVIRSVQVGEQPWGVVVAPD
jgi:YVTN family beta-propeller protein